MLTACLRTGLVVLGVATRRGIRPRAYRTLAQANRRARHLKTGHPSDVIWLWPYRNRWYVHISRITPSEPPSIQRLLDRREAELRRGGEGLTSHSR